MLCRIWILSCLALLTPLSAQELRFAGDGLVNSTLEVRIRKGSPGAQHLMVLAPTVGTLSGGGLTTTCFSDQQGLFLLSLQLDLLGGVRLPLPIPNAPALVGAYLACQSFELTPKFRPSNCASFMIVSAVQPIAITESFDSAVNHAREESAARWASDVAGVVTATPVGGTGQLGVFDYQLGTLRGNDPKGPWVFSTDGHDFPVTRFGPSHRVIDGVFEFAEFHVPAGITVRFEGVQAAKIFVAGDMRIDGTLDVSAADMAMPSGGLQVLEGQLGGLGGVGAASGGEGGDLPSFLLGTVDGAPGGDLVVDPTSSWFGNTLDSGGRPSLAMPLNADPLHVTYSFASFFSNQIAGGGGGGSHSSVGLSGQFTAERAPGGETGAGGVGGLAPVFSQQGVESSRLYYLVGGSGGAGAGAHPYDSLRGQAVVWARGSGGAGGGGALLLVVGGDVLISLTGAILADGGDAAMRTHLDGLLLAPGGGGSGGTLLFQVGGALSNQGLLSAQGGLGGRTEDLRATLGATVVGGDGAAGRIRIEAEGAVAAGLAMPAADVGALTERDREAQAVSTWLRLPLGADPTKLAYELYTVQDARAVLYADQLALGHGPARVGATPVAIYTRFATLDAQGQPVAGTETAWVEGAASAPAGVDAVRFMLWFDRGLGISDCRVECLRLTF